VAGNIAAEAPLSIEVHQEAISKMDGESIFHEAMVIQRNA